MRHASLLALAASIAAATTTAAEPKRQAGDIMFGTTRASKILFLGNSITKHGPSAKIGWTGNWGMAASAEDNDYVHRVLDAIAAETGTTPDSMVVNIATFERNYTDYDIAGKLKSVFDFNADLVVLAIGENVPAPKTDQDKTTFKACVKALVDRLKAGGDPTIVVRTSFWANETKDTILKQVCDEAGGVFVDAGPLGRDEKNYARSEREYKHKGVAAHPGDRGMKAIADAILAAIKPAEEQR
ncbi:MAG: SGNH/GDSL hydrolase family protein [Lentisphaerae bacterium]|jgi:hypothetical protein|nr:SGNH/GDSL hydrolase family protein [Lentisphaerota bacterium]MBT4823531.1 SGNH/GDSL hydrolase family protein [Lentisphaerota bacterium]MBT5612715.1 SGNH/GDSL hydrolase family protein [Lentisphaerota bacterium]MBT7060324.1 SGNH/GDSL hydrolase family protein [Lentisphaerota bacterium]MBT7845614.1 SGNH/GDSL hydrolase family protein [Lentisphaerota bacterium]